MSAEGTVAWGSLSGQEFEERLTALLAAHSGALSRLAASYVRAAPDRDDLLQDIIVAIWRALPRFRGECSERTFIYRIAHNRAIAYITRRRLPTDEPDTGLDVEDRRPNPEETLSAEQEGRRLLDMRLSLTGE